MNAADSARPVHVRLQYFIASQVAVLIRVGRTMVAPQPGARHGFVGRPAVGVVIGLVTQGSVSAWISAAGGPG